MALSAVHLSSKNLRCFDCEEYGEFCILSIGEPFTYMIPSFDVLAVELRLIRIPGCDGSGEEKVFDLFIRNDPDLSRTYPAWMKALDFAVIDQSEFGKAVKLEGLHFPPRGLFVVWEWEWSEECDSESTKSEGSSSPSYLNPNPYIASDTDFSDQEYYDSQIIDSDDSMEKVRPKSIDVVTFKCIGVTHDPAAQAALKSVAEKLDRGEEVKVKIAPEPTNPYDSNAIAFLCFVDQKMTRIGYIVREALPYVHHAIKENQIFYVKFSWVKNQDQGTLLE